MAQAPAPVAMEVRLRELHKRLEQVASQLSDASSVTEAAGYITDTINSRLSTVRAMLATIEGRLERPRVIASAARSSLLSGERSYALSAALVRVRERAQQIAQEHDCLFGRGGPICGPCQVVFPCSARRAAGTMIAICDAVGPEPSAEFVALARELIAENRDVLQPFTATD